MLQLTFIRIWDSDLINLQELSYSEYSDYLLLNEDRGKIRKYQERCAYIFMNQEIYEINVMTFQEKI